MEVEMTKRKLSAAVAVALSLAVSTAAADRVARSPKVVEAQSSEACGCPKLVMLTIEVSDDQLEIWYVVSDKVESVNPGTASHRSVVRTVTGLQREVLGDVGTVASMLGIPVG